MTTPHPTDHLPHQYGSGLPAKPQLVNTDPMRAVADQLWRLPAKVYSWPSVFQADFGVLVG